MSHIGMQEPLHMKLSKGQTILACAAVACLILALFRQPLGLANRWEWIFQIASITCWVTLFILWRWRKSTAMTDLAPAASQRKRVWLIILIVALTSVALPFILPNIGANLPFPQLVIFSVITFVIVTMIILFATHHQR